MFQKLIPFATKHRTRIITLFQLAYVVWIVCMLVAVWANLSGSSIAYSIYSLGGNLGTLAALLFVAVTLPGILGRFGVRHPLITVGIQFRRHTGISMFLVGLAHGMIVSTLPNIAMGAPLFPRFGSELFGMVSLAILTPLFLTSNIYSMKLLGKNWKRLHTLIYFAFWTIAVHIGMQGELLKAVLIGGLGILEILSLIYAWRKSTVVAAS